MENSDCMVKIQEIKNISIFKSVELSDLEEYFKRIRFKVLDFENDEIVAFRGEEVKGFYAILQGGVITEMLKDSGDIKRIEKLGRYDTLATAFIFGEFNRFPVDILTVEKSKILFIEKKEFLKLLQLNKYILEYYLNEISRKAQFLSKNLWESVANKKINQKLAEYILKNSKESIFELKISIKDLSEIFNVSRPSLSRVLSEFIKDGIVEKIGNKKYKILDIESLKNISE